MARWKTAVLCIISLSLSAVVAVPTGGCGEEVAPSVDSPAYPVYNQYGTYGSYGESAYGKRYTEGGQKGDSDEASAPRGMPVTTAAPKETSTSSRAEEMTTSVPTEKVTTMAPQGAFTTFRAEETTTSAPTEMATTEAAAVSAGEAPGAKSHSAVAALPENTTPRQAEWTDHPVYKSNPSIETPILAWYTTKAHGDPDQLGVRGRYTRQGSKYMLKRGDGDAEQLVDVDLLALNLFMLIRDRDAALEFETTRASRMCLVMDVREASNGGKIHQAYGSSDFEMQGPPGYNIDLGIAEWDTAHPLPKGSPISENPDEPPARGYVVCRNIDAGRHTLPGAPKLSAQWNVHLYAVLFAEADGSVPPLTPSPPGWSGPEIKQHEKCPDELHDMWSVGPPDTDDPDTQGMRFKTWHAQKDKLYGCYYGHEHGSFDGLAGYTSRFDYTAWKNNRQDESHAGFKNYVIPAGDKFVVVNLHAATDDFNRFQVDLHTVRRQRCLFFILGAFVLLFLTFP